MLFLQQIQIRLLFALKCAVNGTSTKYGWLHVRPILYCIIICVTMKHIVWLFAINEDLF